MKRMFFVLMACMLLTAGAQVRSLRKERITPEEISMKFDHSAEKLRKSMERLEHTADQLSTAKRP